MTNGSAIELQGVSLRFGRREVLREADLHVRFGEAIAIVGENGAGKTTLLRLCAGLLAASSGVVVRSGNVGYCPQEPGVVDLLDADQHLALFGSTVGLRRKDALVRGRGLLRSFGFPEGDRTVARDLSGGSRQKLNLALTLLGDPDILLLDEPYQGFDHGSYVDFWEHVDEWRRRGRAVLVVTHLLTERHRVDRVVEVRDLGLREDITTPALEVAP